MHDVNEYRAALRAQIARLSVVANKPMAVGRQRGNVASAAIQAVQDSLRLEHELNLSFLFGPICPACVYQANRVYQNGLLRDKKAAQSKALVEMALAKLNKGKTV